MEKVFHFIVVRCCPMSQKPRDVDKKDQAGYFVVSKELGIFWAAGYFRIGWRKKNYFGPMLLCPEARGCRQKDSKLGVFVSTEMVILRPGSDGDNFPFYSGPIMSECQI